MRFPSSASRPLVLALLAVSVIGVSGCSWFSKGAKGDYALSPEARPLEVPPDLNVPNTAGAMHLPQAGNQAPAPAAPAAAPAAPSAAAAAASTSFVVQGERDAVFTKVGTVLEATDGLTIASRAPLLGVYDINYRNSDFLVRVVTVDNGVHVSAVDPRGLPASGAAAAELVASLKSALGG